MDLIRHILLEVEKGDGSIVRTITLPPDTPDGAYGYNVALMMDAGLLEAKIIGTDSRRTLDAAIIRLTWQGHDFLDSVRDDSVWMKAKTHVIKPMASWTFSVLVEWLKVEIRQRVLGVPPSS